MTGTDVLALIVVCATVIGGISIICYTIAYISTNDNLLKYIRDYFR